MCKAEEVTALSDLPQSALRNKHAGLAVIQFTHFICTRLRRLTASAAAG